MQNPIPFNAEISMNTTQTAQAPRAPTTKRMSISLSGDAVRLLEFLAETQGISQNDALRKAIVTEAYLLEEKLKGSKVLLQKSDKEIREVVFR
jgi:hypothetical protein